MGFQLFAAFAVSAGSTSPDRASIVQRAQALLASERKSQSPQKVAAVMFTEEEKDAAVREAVAQAEEEALIVQVWNNNDALDLY